VIQLETAIGAAIKASTARLESRSLLMSVALRQRHRDQCPAITFLACQIMLVSSCRPDGFEIDYDHSDLLLIKSKLYNLEHGVLTMDKSREFGGTPVVKLGDQFKKVAVRLAISSARGTSL
jgi:hypothetical protein